jgi:hypothetical protein
MERTLNGTDAKRSALRRQAPSITALTFSGVNGTEHSGIRRVRSPVDMPKGLGRGYFLFVETEPLPSQLANGIAHR